MDGANHRVLAKLVGSLEGDDTSADKVMHLKARFIISRFEVNSFLRSSSVDTLNWGQLLFCVLEKRIAWHIQEAVWRGTNRKSFQVIKVALLLHVCIATGVILYVMLRELFSSKSPNGVYNAAFKLCKDDVRVQDLLGSNIKAHGEANQRGRRRHTAHQSWYDDQKRLHMAMKFYLKGTLGSGVVHLEVYENDAKDFEYRYLIVESEGGFSKKQVIVRPAELVPGVS
ncbi:TIM21-like protein mitochondrial [Clonorchis sinensis]|uniref:Mitochondrial import inner membrane translocase subunit Tim21 n=1 Tax=Clonorchis sinensis TaxID=79923 RepID=G7YN82_CLOSI|nr:TIM21-like protein mitochondrial [Clonorchis sinensis]